MSQFKILELKPTFVWSYIEKTCVICRMDTTDKCIECVSKTTDNNITDKCEVSFGKCGHIYHTHCIHKWLLIEHYCPIDKLIWEFQKE